MQKRYTEVKQIDPNPNPERQHVDVLFVKAFSTLVSTLKQEKKVYARYQEVGRKGTNTNKVQR